MFNWIRFGKWLAIVGLLGVIVFFAWQNRSLIGDMELKDQTITNLEIASGILVREFNATQDQLVKTSKEKKSIVEASKTLGDMIREAEKSSDGESCINQPMPYAIYRLFMDENHSADASADVPTSEPAGGGAGTTPWGELGVYAIETRTALRLCNAQLRGARSWCETMTGKQND